MWFYTIGLSKNTCLKKRIPYFHWLRQSKRNEKEMRSSLCFILKRSNIQMSYLCLGYILALSSIGFAGIPPFLKVLLSLIVCIHAYYSLWCDALQKGPQALQAFWHIEEDKWRYQLLSGQQCLGQLSRHYFAAPGFIILDIKGRATHKKLVIFSDQLSKSQYKVLLRHLNTVVTSCF